MTSLSIGEQDESFFFRHDQPSPTTLQQSQTSDGIKSIQQIFSTSTSTTIPNLPYRSLSSPFHIPSQQFQCSSPNEMNSFVNQFERRLDDHRLLCQKEYERKIQHMIEIKNQELNQIKLYYENKLNECEENYRQLEIHAGQMNEENKRFKIELEHEKQQNHIEQNSAEQHRKELDKDRERKLHELKIFHNNDKQEIKRQQTRIYQDLLDETNQRLKKLENDYKYHQLTNESVIDEMEKRLVDLRSNVEHLQQIKQKLQEEKTDLIRTNEQLQLQLQELTNKHRHLDRDHTDQIQRYENELKSVRLRCDSSTDLLHKETEVLKSKSSKTINDLEKKLSLITDQFHHLEQLLKQKLTEQQQHYQTNMKECGNDYENKIQILKQELRDMMEKYDFTMQKNEQMKNQMESIQNQIRENEQQLIDKLKFEYQQANQQHTEKLRENFQQELDEIKSKYEQKSVQIKNDLQQINKLSLETKFSHENDKQKLVNEYEQFIHKLEKQYLQKTNEYEKRIEILIAKTHEQLKSMEENFESRNTKQQSIINDQQKIIEAFKDEQNQTNILHEKQCNLLNEQSLREKNEIKAQFDLCMKNLEKNFKTLTLKKEQLEQKLSDLTEQHQHAMMECRLTYENQMKDFLTNDMRMDLENTIHSLKQQVVYLQQRIAFLQQELEQYIQIYGHRPVS